MNDVCHSCGGYKEWAERDGYLVCSQCGLIDSGAGQMLLDPIPTAEDLLYPFDHMPVSTRGRYREIFHWNERISQWMGSDPPIPDKTFERIEKEAFSGKYGPPHEFTRATIIMILRSARLQKLRERWRTLLSYFDGNRKGYPRWSVMLKCQKSFVDLVKSFKHYKRKMPFSMKKTRDGFVRHIRHSFISYNYCQRKLFEMQGIYKYHSDFPVPRSHIKLHALDDVMEKMCHNLGFYFERSAVVKRPKIKKK